ncbi:hypothetical protein ACE4ZV_26500, partial [Salmonella enterica]|uniref:hypothetical protein n=1 Tax=Salmonella enterica TaxID=28901 RepID=UPI003D2CA112
RGTNYAASFGDLAVDASGNAYLAQTFDTSDAPLSVKMGHLFKIEGTGVTAWGQRIGVGTTFDCLSVAIDGGGAISLVGRFDGSLLANPLP